MSAARSLPVIDVTALRGASDAPARGRAAAAIRAACRDSGFFYAIGHGISDDVIERLQTASRTFFALPEERELAIAMARAGRAWRGYFPVGGELTSGRPDQKEGLYFGTEHALDDPRVRAGIPLHGANLFPADVPELQPAVTAFLSAATETAHAILEGIAQSLDLDAQYFRDHYTARPTVLFRIFHYPPAAPDDDGWGVAEHTDYGLLTLLAQDDVGGLQVKTPGGWIDAPPIEGALVCNLGDMLDRLTGGWFRSTPHRVRNASGRERYSFPFFFDPDFDADVVPLPSSAAHRGGDATERWDRANVHAFHGTYGDYLLTKVAQVFPALANGVISRRDRR